MKSFRHDSKRHPEGVHGPQYLYLSAGTFDADRIGYFRLHIAADAEIQFDFDFRLSHARGGRDAGSRAGLHARGRRRICARGRGCRARHRSFCSSPFVLLGDRHEFLHGSRKIARGTSTLGEADEAIQSEGRSRTFAAHTLPDFGLVARTAGTMATSSDTATTVPATAATMPTGTGKLRPGNVRVTYRAFDIGGNASPPHTITTYVHLVDRDQVEATVAVEPHEAEPVHGASSSCSR